LNLPKKSPFAEGGQVERTFQADGGRHGFGDTEAVHADGADIAVQVSSGALWRA
jgi:hypothetical protein